MLITILSVVAGIVALLLIVALFMKKEYTVQSEIVIDAGKQKVFDYVKYLGNQEHFNKWVMMDPQMKKQLTGTDGTAGFIYGWNGNKKAGEGEQEIKNISEGKSINTEIRFIRPFKSVAYAKMTTDTVSDGQTKVGWSNAGVMFYPLNIMLPMVEKGLGKDMDTSLRNLKGILEK